MSPQARLRKQLWIPTSQTFFWGLARTPSFCTAHSASRPLWNPIWFYSLPRTHQWTPCWTRKTSLNTPSNSSQSTPDSLTLHRTSPPHSLTKSPSSSPRLPMRQNPLTSPSPLMRNCLTPPLTNSTTTSALREVTSHMRRLRLILEINSRTLLPQTCCTAIDPVCSLLIMSLPKTATLVEEFSPMEKLQMILEHSERIPPSQTRMMMLDPLCCLPTCSWPWICRRLWTNRWIWQGISP